MFVVNKFLKYFILSLTISFYLFCNSYAENPYYLKTFTMYSTFMAEHKYTQAKQEINNILTIFSDNSEIQIWGHFYLGYVDSYLKDYESAIEAYKYALNHSQNLNSSYDTRVLNSNVIYWLGISYLRLNQYGDATIHFMKSVENYKDSKKCVLALNGLKSCYQIIKKEDDFEYILLDIKTKYSDFMVKYYALKQLADYYFDKSDFDKALSVCQQILNELSIEKYPDLKVMKETQVPRLIQNINQHKSIKK